MYLPEINVSPMTAETISEFYGIEKRKNKMQDGYMEKAINLDTKEYPCAGVREKRIIVSNINKTLGMIGTASHLYTVHVGEDSKGHLYCDGILVTNDEGEEIVKGISNNEKQLISVGAYIIIYPDWILYNTHTRKIDAVGGIQDLISYFLDSDNTCEMYMCTENGTRMVSTISTDYDYAPGTYNYQYYSPILAVAKGFTSKGKYIVYHMEYDKDAENKFKVFEYSADGTKIKEKKAFCCIDIWVNNENSDFSALYNVLKEYEECLVKIDADSSDKTYSTKFSGGEGKLLKKVIGENGRQIKIIFDVDMWNYTIGDPNSNNVLQQVNTQLKFNVFKINLPMPEMDYIVACGNRVWGCSNKNHEIYASKLGAYTTFEYYKNYVSDSYAATIGSSGDFTGAAVYNDYPVFFKENRIITMYGTRPGNYQISEVECDGLQEACNNSVCYMDEYLYYKSRRGIMRFDGNYPMKVSDALGDEFYSKAKAGCTKGKYIIEMSDKDEERHLFVYDTNTRQWMEENAVNAYFIDVCKGNIYAAVDDYIIFLKGNNEPKLNNNFITVEEDEIEWKLETGDILQGITNKTILNKLFITFELGEQAYAEVYVKYDNKKIWEKVLTKTCTETRNFNVPIIPRRCDKLKIKIEGTGKFRLFQITRMSKKAGVIKWQR